MDLLWLETVEEFIGKQAVMETFVDILLCVVPIWLAVMIGLLIGWTWKPRWTGLVFLGLRSKLRLVWTFPPGFGARRLWLAFTALSAFSVGHRFFFGSRGWYRFKNSSRGPTPAAGNGGETPPVTTHSVGSEDGRYVIRPTSGALEAEKNVVTENDLEHLLHLLDGKDGEMAWQSMMERSTANLQYQAWRHEPENAPTIYRSKTVFEDATADVVRDFFWDDEFRPKWDPMLAYFKILEESPHNGTMIIHWIKKFPFFCSDREYIIGRRIWEAGRSYYCVTKGVPYPALPRRDKPRRVDHYFSSWMIRPVQSLKGDGQMSACEVTLIHYEDMGIPKDVAKLGVRHGMWGTVKKLHVGFRAYQNMRKTDASLSRCALMARITTKIASDEGTDPLEPERNEEEKTENVNIAVQKGQGGIDWRWVAVGGAAVAVGLHTGLIGKALLVAAGQRAAKRRGAAILIGSMRENPTKSPFAQGGCKIKKALADGICSIH
ncbi:OLC1v1019825C1 [Oldenlandia corymbosa var. corymbosa]|uniref:OLC1v1019825C1 n=1 Tax=Oldenlandia corymbosa var. corymbosa TaxID=529605 RepID=A0AAV1EEV5_OLDCO|nr:OLC1v1019825C1 [Oldenlandia corymbosa var. corymbosa]